MNISLVDEHITCSPIIPTKTFIQHFWWPDFSLKCGFPSLFISNLWQFSEASFMKILSSNLEHNHYSIFHILSIMIVEFQLIITAAFFIRLYLSSLFFLFCCNFFLLLFLYEKTHTHISIHKFTLHDSINIYSLNNYLDWDNFPTLICYDFNKCSN